MKQTLERPRLGLPHQRRRAHSVFERLAVYQQEGFQDNVEEVLAGPYPADAVAQIDAQLERVGWRYVQGHITDDEYRSKWEHLQERRHKVLAAMESVESPVPLDGILDAWNQGDAQAGRELMQTLFDELDVRDGEIVGYKPRTDKQDEVAALLDPILSGSSEFWHAITSLKVTK